MTGSESIQTSRRKFLGISAKGFLLAIFLQIGFPLRAAASSPKDVLPAYDATARKLTVKIIHSSASPEFHYIEKVEIKKGGKTISATEYDNQPDRETFSYVYPIEAAPGDILEIKAICSILGSKTVKLTVTAS
ncbi:MAG: hypothetical protein FJ122_03690 [Deltaproteobacteria bacterium]|nr:hypothetical protein [Deltaproteobacteria bacterium]